jgi:hypothetical protein
VKRKAVYTFHLPELRQSIQWSTATVIGSSAPMPAILNTVSAVVAMDKKTFQNEALFLMTLHLIQSMRDGKTYHGERISHGRAPDASKNISLFPALYTLDNCIKQSDI